jgi:hypothetical protein
VQEATSALASPLPDDPICPPRGSGPEKKVDSWVDARVVAGFLGVSRDFVYANAAMLGARRLGTGPRARLRFNLANVLEALTPCVTGKESSESKIRTVTGRKRVQSSPRLGSGVALLPIRGRNAA